MDHFLGARSGARRFFAVAKPESIFDEAAHKPACVVVASVQIDDGAQDSNENRNVYNKVT